MNGPFDDALLSRCISCGFCLPACPTYRLTGSEEASPRGRITLMRALQDGQLPPDDPTLAEQASFCLGCRACEPVCPAGVEYGTLLEQWRDAQWQGRRRPLLARLLSLAAARRLPLWLAGLLRRAAGRNPGDGDDPPHLLLGCFERVLFPGVSRAARRLAPALAVDPGQGCCGALHAHNGDTGTGRRLAERLGARLPGRLVSTAGGCAAHLASVLGSDRVVELSAYLTQLATAPEAAGIRPLTVNGRPARIALQDSCHLRNGLGVWREPRQLLRAVGEYVELPGADVCCGAAGTYALLRPRDADAVLAPKLAAIDQLELDYLVVVNPGCQRQLVTRLRRRSGAPRVLHLAQLLDLALRGR